MLNDVVKGLTQGFFGAHYAHISLPRAERLAQAIAQLATSAQPRSTPRSTLLDVGCGDGLIAKAVAAKLGATKLVGIDVKVQPGVDFDVRVYDGKHFPFDDESFDLVTLSDVLHHTEDPKAVLAEALRVLKTSGVVVIKDHFRFGPWSHGILWLMDVVGNRAQGIAVNGHYLSPSQWVSTVREAGGVVDELLWPFHVHGQPIRAVARSEYQFLAKVSKRGGTSPS